MNSLIEHWWRPKQLPIYSWHDMNQKTKFLYITFSYLLKKIIFHIYFIIGISYEYRSMLFSGVTLVYGKNMLINLSYKSLHGSIYLLKCPQFTIASFSWFCLFVFWINSTILKLRPFPPILTSIPSLLIEVQGLQLHKAQIPYKDNYPCKYSGFFRPHLSYSRGTMGYHPLGIMTYTPKHNTYIHTGLLVFWMTTFILWMSSRHVSLSQ